MGENCSSSCLTRDHVNFGACVRAKGVRVAYCQSVAGRDFSTQKRWDAELQGYRDAVAQGIQPSGTTTAKVRDAVEKSNATGVAYDAGASNG